MDVVLVEGSWLMSHCCTVKRFEMCMQGTLTITAALVPLPRFLWSAVGTRS